MPCQDMIYDDTGEKFVFFIFFTRYGVVITPHMSIITNFY
jgi:hypothetical protein